MAEEPAPRKRQPKTSGLLHLRVVTPPAVMAALRREADRRNVSLGVVVTECLRTCLDVEAE